MQAHWLQQTIACGLGALADALGQMGHISRGEVLARHPNVLSAALDELSDESTDNSTVWLSASRVISELLPARWTRTSTDRRGLRRAFLQAQQWTCSRRLQDRLCVRIRET